MIITPQNRETVLQTFRMFPAGLSLSELSRKSGLNRNKCSQICSDYHKKNILGLVQKSSYKIYFLRHQSILDPLINAMSGPVLVVNDSFSVIAANNEFLISFRTSHDDVLGVSGEDLLTPICPDLIPDLIHQLGPGKTGTTATFPDETGAPRCKTLTIVLNESQFCIIILTAKTPPEDREPDRIKAAETRFTTAVPTLIEKTWPQALTAIAELLHETLIDTLIFTLLIDEPLRTCSIHTIATPGPKQARPGKPDIPPVSLTDIEILQYKTGKPVTYYTSTPDSLRSTPLPERIQTLCPEQGITSISLLGISTGSNLTTVLGIGGPDPAAARAFVHLLQAISGYLILLCTACQHASEILQIQIEYQNHYSEIYALLSEKTRENTAQSTEAEHLQSILGEVLDTLKVSLITTTRQGTLIAANKTACTTHGITTQHLADHVSIREALPDLAPLLLAFIPDETGDSPGQTPHTKHSENQQPEQTHWYLLSSGGVPPSPASTYLFIGEPHPARLIRYLKSQAPRTD